MINLFLFILKNFFYLFNNDLFDLIINQVIYIFFLQILYIFVNLRIMIDKTKIKIKNKLFQFKLYSRILLFSKN